MKPCFFGIKYQGSCRFSRQEIPSQLKGKIIRWILESRGRSLRGVTASFTMFDGTSKFLMASNALVTLPHPLLLIGGRGFVHWLIFFLVWLFVYIYMCIYIYTCITGYSSMISMYTYLCTYYIYIYTHTHYYIYIHIYVYLYIYCIILHIYIHTSKQKNK